MRAKKIKHDGKLVDAYYFCLGGSVGQHAGIARPVGYRSPASLVPEAIARLLQKYLVSRETDENLRAWFARHSNDELRTYLAGENLAPVERDLPTGRVPHAVGGVRDMNLLPIFLKLDGRPVLLVGAGNVALEKLNTLTDDGGYGCA